MGLKPDAVGEGAGAGRQRPEGCIPIPGQAQLEGVVLSGLAGFYTVRTDDGRTWQCQARGKVRKADVVLGGDRVVLTPVDAERAVIERVLPRRNRLTRPPVANVTLLVAVLALSRPDPDLQLLDRLLVMAEAAGLEPLVCFNKADLVAPERAEELASLYRTAGYPVVVTSARTGQGIPELASRLRHHVATLGGPSGVGKSALLNALCPGTGQATGEVSQRLGRGRHTTRAVRLLPLPGGGVVADTPGFSRLELAGVQARRLSSLMRDIAGLAPGCAFGSRCLHQGEPGCAVQAALEAGTLAPSRYAHYRRLLEELVEMEARRYS